MILKVVDEFIKEFKSECPCTREEGVIFSNKILYPKYLEALAKKEKLTIDLDGGYGYGGGFIDAAFTNLVWRVYRDGGKYKKIIKNIEIKTDDQITLNERITKAIKDEVARNKHFDKL